MSHSVTKIRGGNDPKKPKAKKKRLTEKQVRKGLDLCQQRLELESQITPGQSDKELWEAREKLERLESKMERLRFSKYRNFISDRFRSRKNLVAEILKKIGKEYDRRVIREFLFRTKLNGG